MPTEAETATLELSLRRLAGAMLLLGVLGAIIGVMIPSDAMSSLRAENQRFSEILSRLDHLVPGLNLVHVLLFAWITLNLRLFLPRLPLWKILAAGLALAVGTELLQLMVPGRKPRIGDIAHDLLGVALGLLLAGLLRAMRRPAIAAGCMQAAGGLMLAGVLALPFVRWETGGLLGHSLQIADLLLVAALGARAIAWLAGAPLRLGWLHAWLGAYLAVMVVASLLSPEIRTGIGKCVGIAYLLSLATLAHELAADDTFVKRFALVWLGATAVVVLASLAAVAGFWASPGTRAAVEPLVSYYGSLAPGNYPRVWSTFASVNVLCNYLVVSLALLFAAMRLGWLRPVPGWSLAVGIAVAGAFTFSTALGAMALVAAGWAWAGLRPERPVLARTVVALGLVAAVLMLGAAMVDLADPLDSLSHRARIWLKALDLVASNPLTGIGVGRELLELRFLAPDGNLQRLTDAHNLWLNVAGQAGLLAVLALAGLSIHLLRGSVGSARRVRDGDIEPVVVMHLAVALAFAGAWLYHGLSCSVEDTRHLWLVMGVLAALRRAPAA